MKGKGALCPNPSCKKQAMKKTAQGHRECSKCGSVGWGIQDRISKVGPGLGLACPSCNYQGLFVVASLRGYKVRRCTVCLYTFIERAPAVP
jgi:hypothetical protein